MRLTKKDIEKMEQEIEERKYVLRPQLIESLKEARAQGDLSENFEYYVAKREKNRNESRIRYLDRVIKTAEIIDETSADDQVGIGDEVTIKYLEDDFEDTYVLVSTFGADSLNNMLSVESPVGKALLGHKIDEICDVTLDNGNTFQVQVISFTKSK